MTDDDEEFTRKDVVTLLLEVMDWTYVQATRERPMTEAEQKVLNDIRTALAEPSEDIETLRRENERLQNLLYDQIGKATALRAAEQMRKQIAELKHAENERLREALGKYGRHLDDCALTLGGYQCTCGFNQQEVPR